MLPNEVAKKALRETVGDLPKPTVSGPIFTCPCCEETKDRAESAGALKVPSDWGTISREICKDCYHSVFPPAAGATYYRYWPSLGI